MNEIPESHAAAKPVTPTHLQATEALDDCAPDQILTLGLYLEDTGPIGLLREHTPESLRT